MLLLIDANVLLDVLMKRQEFVKDSSLIWKLCETEKVKGYISSLTITSIVDIMRKEMDPQKIEEVLSQLSMIFEFTDLCVQTFNRQPGCNGMIMKMPYSLQQHNVYMQIS